MMKQKIDFILSENIHFGERYIFRFYPRRSAIYIDDSDKSVMFGDFYYSIIYQYRDDENSNWESDVKFCNECDEDSIIHDIGTVCINISNGIYEGSYINSLGHKKSYSYFDREYHSFGECTSWIIHRGDDLGKIYYEFLLWRYDNVGYRFSLEENQMKDFGQYLIDCIEYMKVHNKEGRDKLHCCL